MALDPSVKLAMPALRCVTMTYALPLLSEADRQARPPETDGADRVPMPGGVVSFLGSTTRGGDWRVPAHFRVVAVVGKVRLDFRRARFTSPITTIEAAVFAGHLEIGLPRGFRVDYAGNSFGGKLEYHPESNGSLDAAAGDGSAPIVRVVGAHVAGAIDITRIHPGTRCCIGSVGQQKRFARRGGACVTDGGWWLVAGS